MYANISRSCLESHKKTDLPVSQYAPCHPPVHVQLNPFNWSVHWAPFWHGLLLHSSKSGTYRFRLSNKQVYGKYEFQLETRLCCMVYEHKNSLILKNQCHLCSLIFIEATRTYVGSIHAFTFHTFTSFSNSNYRDHQLLKFSFQLHIQPMRIKHLNSLRTHVTVGTRVSSNTGARVLVLSIVTCGTILTRVSRTFINICKHLNKICLHGCRSSNKHWY